MLHEKYADKEYRDTFYNAISRDTQKLDDFSKKISDFARPLELNLQVYDIRGLLDAVLVQALKGRYQKIKLEKNYPAKLPKVPADYHRLKIALANVVENALEAMGGGGKLTVSVKEVSLDEVVARGHVLYPEDISADEMLAVEVKDSGRGIPEEFRGRIFDPFFTTKPGKPGIGLAIAAKIAEAHKGTISLAESSRRGTTIVIYLPV
jgi:signal transduction histidine kinase